MHPYIDIGNLSISSYQASLLLAFALGVCLTVQRPISPDLNFPIGILVLIPALLGALVGAKLIYAVIEGGNPYHIFWVWRGGYYYHGGLMGGITGYLLYLWFTGNSLRDGLDRAAPFAALGEAIARIGCYMAGCCYGAVTHGLTAVVYPPQSQAWRHHMEEGLLSATAPYSMPVHPAPLYTALVMLALYVVLRNLQQHRSFPGAVALYYLLWHGVARVALEYFRDDMPRHANGWTTTQLIASAIAVTAAVLIIQQYSARFNHVSPRHHVGRTQEEHP